MYPNYQAKNEIFRIMCQNHLQEKQKYVMTMCQLNIIVSSTKAI